nr:hypothetical protein [Tanacetum cinerariifolium]
GQPRQRAVVQIDIEMDEAEAKVIQPSGRTGEGADVEGEIVMAGQPLADPMKAGAELPPAKHRLLAGAGFRQPREGIEQMERTMRRRGGDDR